MACSFYLKYIILGDSATGKLKVKPFLYKKLLLASLVEVGNSRISMSYKMNL